MKLLEVIETGRDKLADLDRAASMAIDLVINNHMPVSDASKQAGREYSVSPEYVRDAVMSMLHSESVEEWNMKLLEILGRGADRNVEMQWRDQIAAQVAQKMATPSATEGHWIMEPNGRYRGPFRTEQAAKDFMVARKLQGKVVPYYPGRR